MKMDKRSRCGWMGNDEIMLRYHDEEWGVPVHDDPRWFEFIVLDAFQAGLSWRTVLHKRPEFRQVFHDFDPRRVARMTAREIERARTNAGIIRNRMKIDSAVSNAKAFLRLQEKHGSFDAFLWAFTGGAVVHNAWREMGQIPAATPLSDAISKALKAEGFSFVGSTICYAFLQAAGVVNDHLVTCYRHAELKRKRRPRSAPSTAATGAA